MYGQTLKLNETALGNEHPSTLACMGNLALVPRDDGKYFPLLVTTKDWSMRLCKDIRPDTTIKILYT